MNILHFAHTYLPVFGGTTTRLLNLFKGDGNDHTIVVPSMGSDYVPSSISAMNEEDLYDNVHVLRTPLLNTKKNINPIYYYFHSNSIWKKNAERLLSRIREHSGSSNFDCVYGHNPIEFAMAAQMYSETYKIPYIYEVHGLIKDTLRRSKKPIKSQFDKMYNDHVVRLEKKIFDKSKSLVVQTLNMKNRVINEYDISHEKINVVYNGVDLQMYNLGGFLDERDNKKIVFSYFGFLDDNNGIGFLINCFEKLSSEIKKKIKLVIAGRGPHSQYVKTAAGKNDFIQFLGLLDYHDMKNQYCKSDVFVIPRPSNNATENLLPMKLLEAMAMENIVLVSDVNGMTEVVSHGVDGIVYKTDDESDFIDKITDLTINYDEYAAVSKQARKSVIDNYSWDRGRTILSSVYASIDA